jgi:hypothetical protein
MSEIPNNDSKIGKATAALNLSNKFQSGGRKYPVSQEMVRAPMSPTDWSTGHACQQQQKPDSQTHYAVTGVRWSQIVSGAQEGGQLFGFSPLPLSPKGPKSSGEGFESGRIGSQNGEPWPQLSPKVTGRNEGCQSKTEKTEVYGLNTPETSHDQSAPTMAILLALGRGL